MKNYAGVENVDDALRTELDLAGINIFEYPFVLTGNEVQTKIIGSLHKWTFTRYWRYWVATGPGIPPEYANNLHERFGDTVRVDGHCGCPSPDEWFQGFAVGHYHVDSQDGLRALADTIKAVFEDAQNVN